MVAPAFRPKSYRNLNTHAPFHRLIHVLNTICQLFCAAPISNTKLRTRVHKSKLQLLQRLHCLLGVLILICIYALSWSYMTALDPSTILIEKIFYFGEIIINNFIGTYIVYSTFYEPLHYCTIPRKFMYILKELNRFEAQHPSSEFKLLSKLCKELKFHSLCILMLTVMFFCLKYFHVGNQFFELIRDVGAHNLPSFLLSLKLCQYWLCLRFACLLYKRFNEMLIQRLSHNDLSSSLPLEVNTVSSRNFDSHVPYIKEFSWYKREFSNAYLNVYGDCEILQFIRRLYSDLDALMEQVANIFGFILLLNFLGSLFALSIYIFEIYKSLDSPDSGITLWHLQHLARIFVILISNNAIVEQKCHTSLLLNEIQIASQESEHAINRFLLQLMARKPTETACGIIELDLLLLTGILCTVTNCVMFLIQIDLSNNSFEKMNNDTMRPNNTN